MIGLFIFTSMYKLEKKTIIPVNINEAWSFFSDPLNLDLLTPDDMGFQIISTELSPMYPGQIIQYIVRPFLNIPMKWTTEITQVQAPDFFIDNQITGPYSIWHHQHFFKQIDSNHTEIKDLLHYKLPFGILGEWVHYLFVKNRVQEIFEYREKKLLHLFSS